MPPIYLDYNASTPIAPEVVEAMLPYLEHFGNPSSSHEYGQRLRKAIETARGQVAALLGCETDEVIFTSGGTEANNFALKGYAWANRERGNHLITTTIEHPAALEACKFLERQGFHVTHVPVDELGCVHVEALLAAMTPRTILISVMHANNEVGTIQPVGEIAALAHQAGIVLHCDAAQSAGKVPVRVNELHVDLLSVAGHKLYAPIGAGAVFVRRGIKLESLLHGAKQESNRRAGTENVLEIVGLGKACELATRDLEKNIAHMRAMRDRLREGLFARIDDLKFNGHPVHCLPNTLSVSFRNIPANALLAEVGEELAASAGAACHSAAVVLSHVLEAMNVPREYAMGTIRLSVGRTTTPEEVDRAVEILVKGVMKL